MHNVFSIPFCEHSLVNVFGLENLSLGVGVGFKLVVKNKLYKLYIIQRSLRDHPDNNNEKSRCSMLFSSQINLSSFHISMVSITFGKFLVKAKKSDKYLGQILHEGGLAESVKATIKERSGKVKGAIYATKQIIDTFEMQAMGGMMAAKQLWEGAIIPSLLAGARTWVGATAEAEAMCDQLQELFWRVMFELPSGTPKVMLTAETASLRMKQRIWLQKLLLAKKILSQRESLAGQVYREQLKMGWGGLAKEVENICKAIGVENVNESVVGKQELKTAVEWHSYKEMKEDMEKSKKLAGVKNEDFRKPQEYMKEKSVENARQAFRVRSKMIKSVKMNFKNMHKNEDLRCEKCSEEEETQEHVLMCKEWEELWKDLNTDQISDQVTFFHRFEMEKARMAKEGRQ